MVACVALGAVAYATSGLLVAPGPSDLFRDPGFQPDRCAPFPVTWTTGDAKVVRASLRVSPLEAKTRDLLGATLSRLRPALDAAVSLNQRADSVRFAVTPDYRRIRELAMLLTARGRLRAEFGDLGSAVVDLLTAARIGRSLGLPIGRRGPMLWDADQRATIERAVFHELRSLVRSPGFPRQLALLVATDLKRRSTEVVPLVTLVHNEVEFAARMLVAWGETNAWPREEEVARFARLWLPFLAGRRQRAATELIRRHREFHAPLLDALRQGRVPPTLPIVRYQGRPSSLADKVTWGLQVVGCVDPMLGVFWPDRGLSVVSRLLIHRMSPGLAETGPSLSLTEKEADNLRSECLARSQQDP